MKKRDFFSLSFRLSGMVEFIVILAIIGTFLGCLGKYFWLCELASHFTFQYFIVLFGSFIFLIFFRKFWYSLICLVFLAYNLVLILPFYTNDLKQVLSSNENEISILFANVNKANKNYSKVFSEIKTNSPDILVLQEVNFKWAEHLKSLRKTYIYNVEIPRNDFFGLAIYSKIPIISNKVFHLSNANVPSIFCRLGEKGKSFWLLAMHPVPPLSPTYSKFRNQEFQNASKFISEKNFQNLIVVGDLNTTPFSWIFRNFLEETGLKNSQRGFGFQASWPSYSSVFGIPIDHFLHSENIKILKRKRLGKIGSDHFPFFVTFNYSNEK